VYTKNTNKVTKISDQKNASQTLQGELKKSLDIEQNVLTRKPY